MNETRQPDIEIYIREIELVRIAEWLQGAFADGELIATDASGRRFRIDTASASIPVLLTPNIERKFTAVWLRSPDAPWADDLACARDAQAHFGCEVRCSTGSWQADGTARTEPTGGWWQVDQDGERLIEWPD